MKKVLILIVAVGLTMAGCKGKKAATETITAPVAVKVATAVDETIAQEVEFTANIEPWQKVDITPALQGARIARILVDVGDRVRKGQLVAEMDPTQYNTAKVNFDIAQADFRRIESVYKVGGVSEQAFRQAEAAYLIAKESFDNVASHVKLYSPIDGVVTARNADPGNLFTSTPILELMQIDRLKVRINVSEQYFRFVHEGSEVNFSVDIFPGETFPGKISLVSPSIDPATRTFMAEVTIPNGGGKLRPGMFARSMINMGNAPGVMVSDVAIQRQIGSNERFVWVISDGAAHRRSVEIGRQIGDRIVVTAGLEPGEQVATTSFSRLNEGTPVTIN